MNLNEFQEIKQLLSVPKKIAIVPHRNPDGDAYGSCLALYHYLLKLQHEVTIVSPNDCPSFLKWLPGEDRIEIFEAAPDKGKELLRAAELVFTLDFNAFHRLGEVMEPIMKEIKPVYVMIDHHQQALLGL